MAVCGRWTGQDCGERTQQGTTRTGLAGTLGWSVEGSVAAVAVRLGMEWLAAGPRRGCTGFPRASAGGDAE